jgi:hypothetical protein
MQYDLTAARAGGTRGVWTYTQWTGPDFIYASSTGAFDVTSPGQFDDSNSPGTAVYLMASCLEF